MTIKAKLKFFGQDKFSVQASPSGATLTLDKNKEDYTPQGPGPLELFLVSLGGCVGVYAKRYLERHAREFKELKVEATAELSSEPPIRLADIKVQVSTDAELGDKQEVFLRFIKNCPVHNTLIHTAHVDINLGPGPGRK